MQFSISEFFLTKFSIGRSGASLTKDFRGRLGLATNYEVARLAIGLSMTQGTYPPKNASGSGLTIWSGTLFDHDDYSLWIGLLITNYVQFHPERAGSISMELFQEIVQTHWDNGLTIMQDVWEKSGEDSNKFWDILLHSYADIPDEVAPVIDSAPDSSPLLPQEPCASYWARCCARTVKRVMSSFMRSTVQAMRRTSPSWGRPARVRRAS